MEDHVEDNKDKEIFLVLKSSWEREKKSSLHLLNLEKKKK